VRARNMALPVDGPDYPGMLVSGNPVKLSTQSERAAAEPPPRLGQHRVAILRELGLD
jgi:crotonobetainyl-CoA:carnitine CoA-transferase CaiB-like acyl-CoA transferase